VRRELEEARRGPYPALHSLHEAYAVILEELDELWELVRRKDRDRNPAAVLRELVQLSAMCQRAAEDLGFARGEGS
jgi:NTP pyrophosphatase (non-canonical NTP hydrolase)